MAMPSSAPPKMHANIARLISTGPMTFLSREVCDRSNHTPQCIRSPLAPAVNWSKPRVRSYRSPIVTNPPSHVPAALSGPVLIPK